MITTLSVNAAITKACKESKITILYDSNGLELRISKIGSAVWWFRKRKSGKIVQKKIGCYPEISIKTAREQSKIFLDQLTFKDDSFTVRDAFNSWYDKISKELLTHKNIYIRCQKHIIKKFGAWQFKDLRAIDLITYWEPLYKNGNTATLHKLCSYIKQMSAFAINTGRVEYLHDLTKIRENYVFKASTNHSTVSSNDIKYIFKAFNLNSSTTNLSYNLLLCTCFTLLRIGEVVQLKWEYIDLEKKLIHIPACIMKMKRDHIIPISTQLESLLTSLPVLSEYIFPARENRDDHCSSETLRIYLKRIGLQSIQSAHGIRAMGRTWMAQQGFNDALAELCLHHKVGSEIENIYKRYNYLEERRPLMQAWCDYVSRQKLEAVKLTDTEYNTWYTNISKFK